MRPPKRSPGVWRRSFSGLFVSSGGIAAAAGVFLFWLRAALRRACLGRRMLRRRTWQAWRYGSPQEINPSPAKMLKAGVAPPLPWTAGMGCSLRFWKLQRHLSNVWQHYGDFLPIGIWLCWAWLPSTGGRGARSKLVAAMLDRCDKEKRTSCCVERKTSGTSRFTGVLGFSVIRRAPFPKPLWTAGS